jgi:hypothetical protein
MAFLMALQLSPKRLPVKPAVLINREKHLLKKKIELQYFSAKTKDF